MTEGAMEYACHLIASSSVNDEGVLLHDDEILTAERVRQAIDHWLLDRNYSNPSSIIACGECTTGM